MRLTFGFAPRRVVFETEKEFVTVIAALNSFISRPEPLILSEENVTRDDARIEAEEILNKFQED